MRALTSGERLPRTPPLRLFLGASPNPAIAAYFAMCLGPHSERAFSFDGVAVLALLLPQPVLPLPLLQLAMPWSISIQVLKSYGELWPCVENTTMVIRKRRSL